MAEFLPNGSLYVFLGVASVLFAVMLTGFAFYKGREQCKKAKLKRSKKDMGDAISFKRKTQRNKFLMKRSERADNDEENRVVENNVDKIKAEIDAKYHNNIVWSTVASGENQLETMN